MSQRLPTIIVAHPKERRKKCSVEALRNRAGFVFWKYPKFGPESLENYVQLGFGARQLSPADADRGLLILDGTWRYAATMQASFVDVSVRSLTTCKTAYPRVSKLFDEPPGGLATIEAIYVAHKLIGRDTNGLLSDYIWADEFLRINGLTSDCSS